MKKKAFTLTELLVVVVIIGVLSAVVLPKFNKVLETRKTTEAEELMAAVRTEQEARCTLDKNYANTKDELTVWPKNEGSNYTYALNSTGISATSTNKDYKLKIKSYRDGGICCEGTYCNSLNKSYPSCDDYNVTYTGEECAMEEVDPYPVPETCSSEHEEGEIDSSENCSCGAKKYTKWTCDGTMWTTYVDDASCRDTSRDQDECEHYGGTWNDTTCTCEQEYCEYGKPGWDKWIDEAQACEQPHPGNLEGRWNTSTCKCECPAGSELDDTGECATYCEYGKPGWDKWSDEAQACEQPHPGNLEGRWNTSTCKCECPAGSTFVDRYGCEPESECDRGEDKNLWRAQDCESPQQTVIAVDGPGWQVYDYYPGTWNWEGPHACSCDCGAWEWDNKHILVYESMPGAYGGACRLKCNPATTHDSAQSRDLCANGTAADRALGIAVAGYYSDYWCGCGCATKYGVQERKSGDEVIACYRDNCTTLTEPSGGWASAKAACEMTCPYCKQCKDGFYGRGDAFRASRGISPCNVTIPVNGGAAVISEYTADPKYAKGKWDADKCQCNCPKGSTYSNGVCKVGRASVPSSVDYDNYYGDWEDDGEGPDWSDWSYEGGHWGDDEHEDDSWYDDGWY